MTLTSVSMGTKEGTKDHGSVVLFPGKNTYTDELCIYIQAEDRCYRVDATKNELAALVSHLSEELKA